MTNREPAPSFADQLAELGPVMIDHFNASYPDALAIVGRAQTGLADVTEAEMTSLTPEGFTLAVTAAQTVTAVTLAFPRQIASLDDLQPQSLALVAAARATLGITELTSAELQAASIASLKTYITQVVRTEPVTEHIKQITFGGGDLVNFAPVGPDSFLYVLAPPPGRTELTIDANFSWEQYELMPESERPIGAYYTLRRWRPDNAELDMWFVLHGGPTDQRGAASAWAGRAKPGDPVALWGPRAAFEPPADADWYLLAGDETGVPAIATILESLPPTTTVRAFIEVSVPADHLPLVESPTFDVTWLHRGDRAAGTTTVLADAVKAMAWPGGTAYVWGGGESRAMTAIRKYVRHEIGLEREAASLVAYWRHAEDTTSLADELES